MNARSTNADVSATSSQTPIVIDTRKDCRSERIRQRFASEGAISVAAVASHQSAGNAASVIRGTVERNEPFKLQVSLALCAEAVEVLTANVQRNTAASRHSHSRQLGLQLCAPFGSGSSDRRSPSSTTTAACKYEHDHHSREDGKARVVTGGHFTRLPLPGPST